MEYRDVLKTISIKEKVDIKEIELEMQKALKAAKITCSVQEFVEKTASAIKDYI